jgi:hypothetical protein
MYDYIEYIIPLQYITALAYGDYSALSDEEEQALTAFTLKVPEGSWCFPPNIESRVTFEPSNDVDSLASDCTTVSRILAD